MFSSVFTISSNTLKNNIVNELFFTFQRLYGIPAVIYLADLL